MCICLLVYVMLNYILPSQKCLEAIWILISFNFFQKGIEVGRCLVHIGYHPGCFRDGAENQLIQPADQLEIS